MDIRSTNKGGQSTFNLNTNTAESSTSVQGSDQETIRVNTLPKGNQQGEAYISDGNKNITEKEIGKAVDKFNKLLEDKETHAEYERYGKFKQMTIRIIDDNTKEVIQELPPRKIIDMIDKLCELAGIFVDKKV